MDGILTLSQLVDEEEGRIARLWAKQLRNELQELHLPGSDIRAPLQWLVHELARLLRDRGEEATILWPEVVRQHAALRYEQRFEAEDLVRELKLLERTLIRIYLRRSRTVDPGVLDWIAELTGEAIAASQAVFARLLRTEEVRFREAAVMETVLQHVDVGILLTDAKGGITFATPPVGRLTGIPVRAWVRAHSIEGVRTLLAQLNARHENQAPFRVADMPYVRAVKELQEVRGVLMRLDDISGERRVLELSATPVWLDEKGGELSGVVQTIVDRTEMDRKIEELSGAEAEVRRLQGRLLEKGRMHALAQLASSTAHALNNFLNVVKLRITLLRKEVKPEHLDSLERTVKNLGDLVTRLQDFVVPGEDESLAEVSLSTVVREAVEQTRSDLGPKGDRPAPELELEVDAKGKVRVEPNLFRELLRNLLLSARERLPQGGRIRVSTETGDGVVYVRVEDSGEPFTVDEMTRLFDPLKVKTELPHLALLVAAGRTQLQRWGGELTYETHAGPTGAARVLRLPRIAEHRDELTPPVPSAIPRRPVTQPSRRVLVVDDEPENARMLAEVLEDEGYEVRVAHSAEMAMRLWDRRDFDAALLDALMPDMSGWELASKIRARSPEALIAMVTGADVRGQNRETLALVDAVFRKPIDVATLDEFLAREGAGAQLEPPGLHA